MFLSCLIVIVGVPMTFVESADGKSPIGHDFDSLKVASNVAKCSSICKRDHYCFFFGVDDRGICQTFKTFDYAVKYRLYARKPAATINFLSSPFHISNPCVISIEGKADFASPYRGVNTVELDRLLNKLENNRNFDVYQFGHHLTNYIQGAPNGTIIAAATTDDATNTLNLNYLKSQGLDFSSIRFRDPYVFLMQKGYPNKSILIINPSIKGNLVTSIKIYRPIWIQFDKTKCQYKRSIAEWNGQLFLQNLEMALTYASTAVAIMVLLLLSGGQAKNKTFADMMEENLLKKHLQPVATIEVSSVGYGYNRKGKIVLIGGNQVPAPYRGIVVVRLNNNHSQTALGDFKYFDTYTSIGAQEFENYIEKLALGDIVVAANTDDIIHSLRKHFPYLKSVGLDFGSLAFRGKMAFIFQKGYPGKTIIRIKPPGPEDLVAKFSVYVPYYGAPSAMYYFYSSESQ